MNALRLTLALLLAAPVFSASGEIIISEFLASNSTNLADEDGEFSDWIEISNTGVSTVDLNGWYLTDVENYDILDPDSVWIFPSRLIESGERLVVFASGKNRKPGDPGELHTHFKLSSNGEYLALIEPDGTTVATEFSPNYPDQETDISYGLGPSMLYIFFPTPTPGTENDAGFTDFVGDTQFSIDRGFYDTPFDVVISTNTPGATIIYTTDGSTPDETNGTSLPAPATVSITTTTPLRAIAVKDGYLPSNVDTQTYLFLADVIDQGNSPPGYPATWKGDNGVGTKPADYAMDPEITDSAAYNPLIEDALLAVPTISIVTAKENLFDPTTGIYQNPQQHGSAWERPASFEVIHPDGTTEGMQVDVGIRIQGGHTRLPSKNPKHSFRLSFTSEFGPTKLNYDLFPDDPNATQEFDQLILRGAGNQSWLHHNTFKGDNRGRAQYIRDQWAKDTQLAMGHPAIRSTYAHVYINGIYWGLYNPTERGTAGFGESYLGGAKEEYQTLNSGEAIDGANTSADYNALIALTNAGLANPANYAQIAELLDLEAFTDYMLIHQYGGNLDWDHHNWYALRNKEGGKWYFLSWDSEFVFISPTDNVLSLNNANDPSRIWRRLLDNAEYRILFADRVQKNFYNNGLLTPDSVVSIWDTRKDQMFDAIVAESARWGDYRRDVDPVGPPSPIPLYDRDEEWAAERTRLFTAYFPVRTNNVIEQYRAAGYFPDLNAPIFSQHGGPITQGTTLGISTPDGTIYYTIDGSDPRQEGGEINPSAAMLSGGSALNSLISLESEGWRYLDTGSDLGTSDIVEGHPTYNSDNWKHPNYDDSTWEVGRAMLGYGGITGGTINTTVDYGGVSSMRHPTTHLRKHFSVTDASSYQEINCDVRRDDAAIVYLNGREIARTNIQEGTVDFETFSESGVFGAAESAPNLFTYQLSPSELLEGNNVLAVEVHQQSAGSNDLGIDVKLDGLSIVENEGFTVSETTQIRARTLKDGEWSSLTEATFFVGTLASSDNTVVSEIMYNPAGEGVEFLELANTSQDTINLSQVHFSSGIEFTIPIGTSIPPGGFYLITDFGNDTSLANNGEVITLLAADGSTIESFRYDDDAPWPEGPDGSGPSLTRILPAGAPGNPESWRPSLSDGGSPNAEDSIPFSANPTSDNDGDEINALLEHAFGSSDSTPDQQADFFSINLDGSLQISLQRNLAADDIEWTIEYSTDLDNWSPESNELVFLGSTNNGDGTATSLFSINEDIGDLKFWRVRATLR